MPIKETLNILLVEDHQADARLATVALRSGSVKHNVQWVQDGDQAMDAVLQQGEYAGAARPDVVLLDLDIPKKDGHEVLRRIKTDPALKAIAVFVLTNSSDNSSIERTFMNWADTYIVKPLALKEFAAAYQQHRVSHKVGGLSGFDLRDNELIGY